MDQSQSISVLPKRRGGNATASDTVGDRGPGHFRAFQFQCRDERAGDISGNGDKHGRRGSPTLEPPNRGRVRDRVTDARNGSDERTLSPQGIRARPAEKPQQKLKVPRLCLLTKK